MMFARRSTFLACLIPLVFVTWLPANDFEEILFLKFHEQNKLATEKLRAHVNDAAAKAKELQDESPETGLELLREAFRRLDAARMLPPTERRAMSEVLKPLLVELRGRSILKKRLRAVDRMEAFREYLTTTAIEGKYPGRSGPEHWEPAYFTTPDGQSRLGMLYRLGTATVSVQFGREQKEFVALTLPIIQVFGGFYVFDLHVGHHLFLTNREYYQYVFRPYAREFTQEGTLSRLQDVMVKFDQAEARPEVKAQIQSGEFFLRTLASREPIPGVGDREFEFNEFLTQKVVRTGLPMAVDRMYPGELFDRLKGMSLIQMSATRRAVFLMRAKEIVVSNLYAEILREETAKLLRSEYAGFSEQEMNRTLVYVFGKIR